MKTRPRPCQGATGRRLVKIKGANDNEPQTGANHARNLLFPEPNSRFRQISRVAIFAGLEWARGYFGEITAVPADRLRPNHSSISGMTSLVGLKWVLYRNPPSRWESHRFENYSSPGVGYERR